SNKNYPPDAVLKITTLEDVLFLGPRNDVAFFMEDRLVVLIEHQSTVCENMPLRLLIYVGDIYGKWLNVDEKLKRAVYGTKLVKIPKPEFYVLYNGRAKFPERKYLRLSDAFHDIPEAESAKELFGGLLELTVPVYNINKGFNTEMLEKSETLFGYAFFVDLARKYEDAGYETEEAIRKAEEDCIEQGILADFLRHHSLEVIKVLTAEFRLEDALQVWKEEGIEEGIEKGKEEGKKEGREEGKKEGREEGKKEGREEGREEGMEEMARNLLANGIPPDIIAQSAGLPLEKIQALAG
ncbi:MAG: hypothetical protein LBU13_11415, partial [Synergistaceae bacterium]|nr:hypothetical protein [Synergistaceae bacterium]